MKAHLNWTIPVPVILAILGQAVVLGIVIGAWKTSIEKNIDLMRSEFAARASLVEARVSALEIARENSRSIGERVKGVEVNIDTLKEQTQRIENKIDKIIDGGR